MSFRTLCAMTIGVIAVLAGSLLGLSTTATASTATVSPSAVTPKLTCAYSYVCGQGANGNSFAT
jgi:hypothetical protein